MHKLRVNLKKEVDYSYDIEIGSGFIADQIKKYIEEDALFLADSNVYKLYSSLFEKSKAFVFEASEDNKSFESVYSIMEFLHENKSRRDTVLVVVGGGIAGDLGGFASSMYMRGIKFIQIPTTVLSMVDSSVGGKTAVNFKNAKNNVGAFYQPSKVLIDIDFLDTLSDEEYLNGVAEIIKYGAVFDTDFFQYLIDNKDKLLAKDKECLKYVVERCCAMKAHVVEVDEKEQGLRMLLNFGHTFGHAIESDSKYEIKHGYAIAAGMYLETDFAEKNGYAESGTAEKIKEMLISYGFSYEYCAKSKDVFLKALSADKKADKSGITLALTPKIGSGNIVKGVSSPVIEKYFFD